MFRSKCKLSFQFGTNNPYIEFSYENRKGKMNDHTVFVKGEELAEVKYHIPDENDEDGADLDSMTMIAFRINPSKSNGFDKYSSSYSQENNDDPEKFHKQFISVEVRDTDVFTVSMLRMRKHELMYDVIAAHSLLYLFHSGNVDSHARPSRPSCVVLQRL